jgi:ComF family protein
MLLKNILHPLLHLFLPHVCAGCGSDVISTQQVLCLHCLDSLPLTGFHLHAHNPVEKIFWGRLPLVHAASYLYFTKNSMLQHVVHQIKYKGNTAPALLLGRKMGEALLQTDRFQDVEILIPLPLHAARARKRGYNQAAVLCKGITEVMRLPVLEQVIRRNVPGESQTHKNRIARWQNMQGKFELLQPDAIAGKHILLVDDVITTGATLEACARELLKAPGTRVSIFTMAYAAK